MLNLSRRRSILLTFLTGCLCLWGPTASAANDLQWYTDIPDGATRVPVDGIVCDNPAGSTASTPRVNVLYADLPAGFTNPTVTLRTPQGGSTDSRGLNNVGTTWVANGKIFYLPPDEYNPVQQPRSNSEVSGLSTRLVNVRLTSSAGTKNAEIILARPPLILIHGINSYPGEWKKFTDKVSDQSTADNVNLSLPYLTVNHRDPKDYQGISFTQTLPQFPLNPDGGIFQANGPVEVGAWLLADRIQKTIHAVHNGCDATDCDQNSETDRVHTFHYEWPQGGHDSPPRMAIRRVDIVAWSYGGLIARWYLATGSTGFPTPATTRQWYQRQEILTGHNGAYETFPSVNYANRQDVRKLITLASMWRGTPMANFGNEVRFGDDPRWRASNDVVLADNFVEPSVFLLGEVSLAIGFVNTALTALEMPTVPTPDVTKVRDVADVVEITGVPLRVPSLEVMAINSRWLRQLIYGSPEPYVATGAKQVGVYAFVDDVAYGSVAGTSSLYLPPFDSPVPPLDTLGFLNPYGLLAQFQRLNAPVLSPTTRSYFPYLLFEYKWDDLLPDILGSSDDYTDGVVPVWSALIPGTYPRTSTAVSATHTSILQDTDTALYVMRWLNNSTLPKGAALKALWNQTITAPDGTRSWTFLRGQMAPSDRDAVYKQIGNIARLNASSLREITPTIERVTATRVRIRWQTTVPTNNSTASMLLLSQLVTVSGQDPLLSTSHMVYLDGNLPPGASVILDVQSQVPSASGGAPIVLKSDRNIRFLP